MVTVGWLVGWLVVLIYMKTLYNMKTLIIYLCIYKKIMIGKRESKFFLLVLHKECFDTKS